MYGAGVFADCLDIAGLSVHTRVMRTADKITLCRIILAPVIFAVYRISAIFPGFSRASIVVVVVVTAAAECTDFLDGFYARRHNEVSWFGKIFDPFADVILHLTLFVCCAFAGYMPVPLLLLILYREFSMLFFRLLAVQKGTAIGARGGGKAKTVLYVFSVFCTFALEGAKRFGAGLPFESLRAALVVVFSLCVAAAYFSFIDYIVHFKKIYAPEA
jgi:CDP-diacylglycerol--glycerol-3-phosphate 3-phosphatidyltransferase